MSETFDRRNFLGFGLLLGAGATSSSLAAHTSAKTLGSTPAQEIGPFYSNKDQPDTDWDLTRVAGSPHRAEGEMIRVAGRVRSQNSAPISGAVVEVWQASSRGKYHHERDRNPTPGDSNFQGRAMLVTDSKGRFSFTTVKPGRYPLSQEPGAPSRTPHIHLRVVKRGHEEIITQMYFPDEAADNAKDRPYLLLSDAERALSTARIVSNSAPRRYQFDVTLEELVDPAAFGSNLEAYVGTYAAGNFKINISQEGGMLHAEVPPLVPKVQLRALATHQFRFSPLPHGSLIEFVTAEGHTHSSGVIIRMPGSPELKGSRIQG